MSEIVLEIGTEEIPARFMPGIVKQMKEKAAEFVESGSQVYRSTEDGDGPA